MREMKITLSLYIGDAVCGANQTVGIIRPNYAALIECLPFAGLPSAPTHAAREYREQQVCQDQPDYSR